MHTSTTGLGKNNVPAQSWQQVAAQCTLGTRTLQAFCKCAMREFWHDHFSFYTLERKSYAQSRASQFRLIKLLLLRAVGTSVKIPKSALLTSTQHTPTIIWYRTVKPQRQSQQQYGRCIALPLLACEKQRKSLCHASFACEHLSAPKRGVFCTQSIPNTQCKLVLHSLPLLTCPAWVSPVH